MVKDASELSEKTQMCFALRPVMRVCHSRPVIIFEDYDPRKCPEAKWEDDRDRYIMSAVEVREFGGVKRPQVRNRWLKNKYKELGVLFEESPYNHIEDGEGDKGLVGCGIGHTYIKEAVHKFRKNYPILKLGTLPTPKKKVLQFMKDKRKVVVFEEIEPVVEDLLKQLCHDNQMPDEVYGRSDFYRSDGELTAKMVIDTVEKPIPNLKSLITLSPMN